MRCISLAQLLRMLDGSAAAILEHAALALAAARMAAFLLRLTLSRLANTHARRQSVQLCIGNCEGIRCGLNGNSNA